MSDEWFAIYQGPTPVKPGPVRLRYADGDVVEGHWNGEYFSIVGWVPDPDSVPGIVLPVQWQPIIGATP